MVPIKLPESKTVRLVLAGAAIGLLVLGGLLF